MLHLYKILALTVLLAAAGVSWTPAAALAALLAGAGGPIVGQCWQNGTLLYEQPLGDSSDPGFAALAQRFLEQCRGRFGEAKFVEAPAAPKQDCVCDDFDVKLGYTGYIRRVDDDWTHVSLLLRYRLKCTAGDTSNCGGKYELLYADGPSGSGAHIPRRDKGEVECVSLKCDAVLGKSAFTLRVRTAALAGDGATIKIKVRYGCKDAAKPSTKTFRLVLDLDGLRRNVSDLDGDGKPDRLR